jgi:hypothetical protein
VFAVQVSPVGLQEVAGTSQVPPTQLSEQQSVFTEHFWWNERQVAQLTPGLQVVPKQHPFEQVVLLQTQAPFTQAWPVEHCAVPPQVQTPLVQASARVVLQVAHAPPFLPQLARLGVSQVLPEQQPVVHVCAHPWHTLLTQVLAPHEAQAAPPEPHAPCWLPGWQTPLASQQPPGQLAASQTQAPETQARPAPHGAPLPQLHTPLKQVSAVSALQTLQAPPPAPQVAREGGLHVVPLQHPAGHEVASQTHSPPWQLWPAEHAGPPPQVHAPAEEQASARVVSHVMHPPPPVPQEVMELVRHWFPLQQPFGHEVASQVQAPPVQCWPLGHAAPEPQAQAPFTQASAPTGSQGTHAAPAAPHAVTEVGVQVLPLQQPVVQVCEQPEHTPFEQVCALPQGAHIAPAVPQAVAEGVVHWLLVSQHPVGQEVASQTQAPPVQCWPLGHGAPEPQAQAPLTQESARTGLQAVHAMPGAPQAAAEVEVQAPLWSQQPLGHEVSSQAHAPPEQCWPWGQPAPLPQVHAPAVHPSARVASQGTHERPPVPQLLKPEVAHVLPMQQPVAHDWVLHTHWPLMHACPAAHCAAPPQLQAPPVQPSARVASQGAQAAPFVPQLAAEGVVQAPFEQHPAGQLEESQVPASEVLPASPPSSAPPPSPPSGIDEVEVDVDEDVDIDDVDVDDVDIDDVDELVLEPPTEEVLVEELVEPPVPPEPPCPVPWVPEPHPASTIRIDKQAKERACDGMDARRHGTIPPSEHRPGQRSRLARRLSPGLLPRTGSAARAGRRWAGPRRRGERGRTRPRGGSWGGRRGSARACGPRGRRDRGGAGGRRRRAGGWAPSRCA